MNVTEEPRTSTHFDRDAVLAVAGPQLDVLKSEVRRVTRLIKLMRRVGWILPVGVMMALVTETLSGGVFFGVMILAVALAVGGFVLATRILRARSRVMEALAPALGLAFDAHPTAPLDLTAFRGTYYGALFAKARVEDVLSGERNGASFQFFDVKLSGRTPGAQGAERMGRSSGWPDWLSGGGLHVARVVRVEAPGNWTARTVILNDYGVANRAYKPKGMERVGFVDSRFEKTFEVFSTDQTEARALLDPAFMERLQELEHIFRLGETPAVAVFEGGAFLVAVPLVRGEEEAEVLARRRMNAVDDYVVDRILWELDAVLGVVEAVAGTGVATSAGDTVESERI